MVCWSLWNHRNKWIWERFTGSVFGAKSAALNLLMDWRKACEVEKKAQQVNRRGRSWNRPPEGWYKINLDAAVFQDGYFGVGQVIRDANGQFIRARCRRIQGNWQPREAEALSLKEALAWVKNLGFDHCVFETDAKNLVEACKGREDESYFHTIVGDCVYLYKHFDYVLIEYVSRSANNVAHLLVTYSKSDFREWIVDPHEFINHVLVSDIS